MQQTVSFVPISEVLAHMQFGADEQADIFDFGFKNISFGDANHTLIDNQMALECILMVLDDEQTETRGDVLATRYWELVGIDDFIDLEN